MLDTMHAAVGRILQTIDDEGIADDTLVIWVSDNGGPGHTGASSAPLRGGKASAFEGEIRAPAPVYWAGKIEGGGTIDQQIVVYDWLPTLAAAGYGSRCAGLGNDGVGASSASDCSGGAPARFAFGRAAKTGGALSPAASHGLAPLGE